MHRKCCNTMEKYGVELSRATNIDQTAVRLLPTPDTAWAPKRRMQSGTYSLAMPTPRMKVRLLVRRMESRKHLKKHQPLIRSLSWWTLAKRPPSLSPLLLH